MADEKFMDGMFDTELSTCSGMSQLSSDLLKKVILTVEDSEGNIIAQAEGNGFIGVLLEPKDVRLGVDIVDRDNNEDCGTSMAAVWFDIKTPEDLMHVASTIESLEEVVIPLAKRKLLTSFVRFEEDLS